MKLKNYWRFLAVFLFLLVSLLILEQTKTLARKDNWPVMLNASRRMEVAMAAVREEKLNRGYKISPIDDPNQTGMIGEPYTEITTTLGNLEAKRSTANPNTAAMVVDMLTQCGAEKGDTVAVNLSSSFPCLNLAVLCALDAMELKGIVINSVGASTYGANLPDFTYLDMEHFLVERQYLSNHSTFFSLGGQDDIGREMPEETKKAIVSRLSGFGYKFLYYEDLDENIAVRQSIYEAGAEPACFINAGGNLMGFGGGTEMVSAANGIILPGKSPVKGHGLIPLFLNRGVPVIHLLNMKGLLPAYGLPFDPSPIPATGEGGVYDTWQYHLPLAVGLLLTGLVLLIWAAKKYPHRKIPL